MPVFSRDNVPVTASSDVFEQRSVEVGDLLLSFDRFAKGDYTDAFKDLPGGRCQSPHWGYLLKGRIRIIYEDREEIVEAGQAFYFPPGHVPEVLEDVEIVQFSEPAAFHTTVDEGFEHAKAKAAT